MKDDKIKKEEKCGSGCCSGGDGTGTMKTFSDFVTSVSAPGKIDKRTKQLIIFSLAVIQRCEPCIDLHYNKSINIGITPEELDEAVWCAVLVGGAPVKLYYNGYLERRKS